MIVGNLIVKIGGDLSGYAKAVSDTMAKSQAMSQQLDGIGSRLTTGLTLPIVGAGVAAVKAASNVEEMRSKFNAVFKDLAGDVEQWAKTHADSIGRSHFDLMNYAADIQDTFVPLGFARKQAADMSMAVVELAEDLASFKNLRTEDVVRGLTSALVGNVENLRQFGVVANEAEIKQKALALGIIRTTKEALTPQQKAMAIWKLTLEGTVDAQGDAAKTAGGFANQMRNLQGKVNDLAVTFGEQLLPTITSAVESIGNMVDKLNALDKDALKTLTGMFVALAAAGPALSIFARIARFGGGGVAIAGTGAAFTAAELNKGRNDAVGVFSTWFADGLLAGIRKVQTNAAARAFAADFPVGPDANAFFAIQKRLAENAKENARRAAEQARNAPPAQRPLARIQTASPLGDFGDPRFLGVSPQVAEKAIELATAGKAMSEAFQKAHETGEGLSLQLREIAFDADVLKTKFEEAGAKWEADFVNKVQNAAGIIQGAVLTMGSHFESLFESIVTGVDDSVGAMRKLMAGMIDTVRAIIAAVKAQIVAMLAVDAATKLISGNIVGALASIGKAAAITAALSAAEGILAGGIKSLLKPPEEETSRFGVPALAAGGIVNRPTLAMIGEAGPEAVIPLRNAGLSPQLVVQGSLDVSFSKFHFAYETWKRNRGM